MLSLSHRLQFRDLRLIQAIRDTGQLALAADRLAMTQPAASRMLAGIERTIGSPLFVRHPKGMAPTPVGEVLSRSADNLLNTLEESLKEAQAVELGRAGTARVGSVTGGAVAFVVPAIQQLKKTATGSDIHIDVAPSDVLIDGLLKGQYDFVLSRIPAGVDARLFSIRRGRVEVIKLLVRKAHPLATRRHIVLQELADYEWLIQPRATPMRQAVEEAFVLRQAPLPTEIINTTSLLVMISYLVSTDAIAPITREVADLLLPGEIGGGLTALDMEDQIIVNPYHLITRRNQVLSPLAVQLRDLVFERLMGDSVAGAV